MRNFLSMIMLLVAGVACNKTDSSDGIIAKKEMMAIMKELAMAEDFVTQFVMKDSTKKHKPETMALYNKIFTLHKTDSKIFMKSFDYYMNQPKQGRDMFDSLVNELRRYEVKPYGGVKPLDSLKPESAAGTDTASIKMSQRSMDSINLLNRMNKPRKERIFKHINTKPI